MKTVFITGAAAGIGLATARHFSRQGYFVGLYDVNREALERVMAEDDLSRACSGYCDVTSRDSIQEALADFTRHTDGKLHVLVNNAGVLSAAVRSTKTGQLFGLFGVTPLPDATVFVDLTAVLIIVYGVGFTRACNTACSICSVKWKPPVPWYAALLNTTPAQMLRPCRVLSPPR